MDGRTQARHRRHARRAIGSVIAIVLLAVIGPATIRGAVSENLVRFPVGGQIVTASAVDWQGGNVPARAIDGNTGNDWAASGWSYGDWWRATFSTTVTLDRIKLYPRDGACDNFGFGHIRFSDGGSVPFDIRGTTSSSTPLTVDFAPRQRIIWLEIVSDAGMGVCNPGLAEVEAFDTVVSTTANLLRPDAPATYSASSTSGSNVPARAADGNTTLDWAGNGRAIGTWWRVDWGTAQSIDRVRLYPRDGNGDNFGIGTIHFSDSSTVGFNLTSYTNSSNPLTIDFGKKTGITWMRVVTDNGGGTGNPGLAEVEVFDTQPPPQASIPDLDAASDTIHMEPVPRSITLRPDGDASMSQIVYSTGSTGWVLIDEVAPDANDWLKVEATGHAWFTIGDTGLDPGTPITEVVVHAYIANPAIAWAASLGVRQGSSGEPDVLQTIAQGTASIRRISLPVRTWDGRPWTAADVDGLQVGFVGATSYGNLRVYQTWVEVTFFDRGGPGTDADDITSDTTPTIGGTVESGAVSVDLYDGATLVGTDTTLSGGTWEITPDDPLGDGVHTLWVLVTDGSAQEWGSPALSVTIDSFAEARLTSESDTGALVPTLEVVTLRPDSDIAITGTTEPSSGSTGWNLVDEYILRTDDHVFLKSGSITFGLADADLGPLDVIDTVTVKASVRNPAAANAGALFIVDPATSTSYGIATIPQNAAASQTIALTNRPWDSLPWTAADIDALRVGASCTCGLQKFRLDQLWVEVTYAALREGAYDSDRITSDTTPTVVGNVSPLADRVEVLEDAVLLAVDDTITAATWSATLPTLAEGEHELEIIAYDENDDPVGGAPPLTVVIDTTPPDAPSTPDLDPGSDTGASSTDDITDDISPSFSGTVPSGAIQVELFAGEVRVGIDTTIGSGTWAITSADLPPGTYSFTARATDAAGNHGTSAPLEVEIVAELVRFVAYSMPIGDVGSVTMVSVVVQDETRQPIDDWTGTITLSSSDGSDTFPDGATHGLVPSVDGTGHTFRVVFGDAGSRTLTASAPGVIPGTTTTVVVGEVGLELSAPEQVAAGEPFALRVRPVRADGRTARTYVAGIAFDSTDGTADYGPEVDNADEYRFDCLCGDAKVFATTLSTTGTQTISVEDEYGNTDEVEISVIAAPTGGSDPLDLAYVVRWDFASTVDYYIDANAPLTVVSVEDIATSSAVIGRHAVGRSFGAGTHGFSSPAVRDGHIVAPQWYQPTGRKIWYTNASGTLFSKAVTIRERFSQIPGSSAYRMIDPGDAITGWSVATRNDTATTIEFQVEEPAIITRIGYSFQGTGWDFVDRGFVVTPGMTRVALPNDPATCYFGNYYENNNLHIEYQGLASGRVGRVISLITHGTQRYSGSCSNDPGFSAGDQAWISSSLQAILGSGIEQLLTLIADPIDVADGFANGPVTDIALGGLEPALAFSRTYDGRTAEDAVGQSEPDTLLGPGWTTSLDWRIETFGTDPEGVIVRGGDGGRVVFLRNDDDSYSAIDGSPFTFEEIVDGYELRRLDRSGYRFDENGRLEAVLHRSGREMTLDYDGNGFLDSFTDAAGRTATVTTDTAGRITRIDLPGPRHVDYAYDADGRLIEVTDLSGSTIGYEVDRRNRITAIRDDQDRVVLRNVHDGKGRVIAQTDGEGAVTHLAFDPDDGMTQGLEPDGGLVTHYMDPIGHVIATWDAEGGSVLIDHDPYGHVRAVTDQLGGVTVMERDPQGRLLALTDPLERTIEVDYDGDGDPIELVDAEGRTVEVAYDLDKLPEDLTITDGISSRQLAAYTWTPQEQLETITEPGGAVTTFDYDVDGYLESMTDDEDRRTTYEVDDRGFVTTIVDPAGNVILADPEDHDWLYGYDDLGRLLSAEDPTGATTTYTYDGMGRVETMTDAAGIETTYAYDLAGRLVSESIAIDGDDPAVTGYEYDTAGNRTAVIDAEGRRTEYEHDLLGRVVLMRDANEAEWTTTYDAKGRVIARTDPTERTTTYAYDDADRLVLVTDPGGHETAYEYDDADRLVRVTDELGGETLYEYDWLGRRIRETDAEENVTEYAYDAADDLVSVTDALLRETVFEYDDTHRLTKVIDALDGETEYAYDPRGLLASRTDARGHTESYEYDAAGRPTLVTDPLAHEWLTVYDAAGRVDHTIDPNDDRTDYAYDGLGRVETITPEFGDPIGFVYDLTGRRESMTDGAGTTVYAYDPVGRLTETLRGGRTIGYDYDDAGRLIEVDYPASLGTVTLDHDAEGRLGTITDWDSRVTTFGYDALDRVTSVTRPGSLVSTYGYDALGRVTSIGHAYASSPVLTLGYGYDPVGNLVERTDDEGTSTFTYDDLDRLTEADFPGASDHAYAYDEVGNLVSITTPAGTTTLSYDDADRIDTGGYVYDDAGSLLTDGTRTFTWDALGRLTGVSGGGHTASYVLDGDGNRVSQTVDTVTTDLDLDLRGMPVVLTDGERLYLPGMPSLGSSDGIDWVSNLTDAQGSVIRTIDAGGSLGPITRYDPYGAPRASTSIPEGIGYTGEWADATGLVDLRARTYDPSLGRFLSRDAFPGITTMPLTGNRHAYAVGNPYRYTDPSGRFISALTGLGWLDPATRDRLARCIDNHPELCSPDEIRIALLVPMADPGCGIGLCPTLFGGEVDLVSGIVGTVAFGGLVVGCIIACPAIVAAIGGGVGTFTAASSGGFFGLCVQYCERARGIVNGISAALGGGGVPASAVSIRAAEVRKAAMSVTEAEILNMLTRGERAAMKAFPHYESAFRGTGVHRAVAQKLGRGWHYSNRGPDFTHIESGIQIELTTPGQLGGHIQRYGPATDMLTYVEVPLP